MMPGQAETVHDSQLNAAPPLRHLIKWPCFIKQGHHDHGHDLHAVCREPCYILSIQRALHIPRYLDFTPCSTYATSCTSTWHTRSR